MAKNLPCGPCQRVSQGLGAVPGGRRAPGRDARRVVCDGVLADAGLVGVVGEGAFAFGNPALTYRANFTSPRWGWAGAKDKTLTREVVHRWRYQAFPDLG